MYEIIHTDAYILNDREEGEESKVFLIFSRELGLCSVHAQSIRRQTSKMKSVLQPGNKVFIDIVIGKKIKRATTVLPHSSFLSLFKDKAKKHVFIDTLLLLTQLIPRNIQVVEIFDEYDRFIEHLKTSSGLLNIQHAECIFVLRLLSLLGYIEVSSYEKVSEIATEKMVLNYRNQINKVLKNLQF